MSEHRLICPDAEILAAFVDGVLSNDELALASEHLLACRECRQVVGEAARYSGEVLMAPTRTESRRIAPWWLAAAAAALVGVAFLSPWQHPPTNESIAQLVEATPRDARYVQPRLSGGFPWAPMRALRGGATPLSSQQLKFLGTIGDVLERSSKDDSIEARHAAAVATLLAGQPTDASALLSGIVTTNPRILSDRAAAYYTEAVATDDSTRLAHALAAADEAVRLAPKLPEALFNRALILESLGARNQARAAWEQYLAVDHDSNWAGEARRHLQALQPLTDFPTELEQHYKRPSEATACTLARRFPQDARVWGESEILARWAAASTRGDTAAAAAQLSIARTFGNELARNHGDTMLKAAVTAIDAADPEQQNTLSQAQLSFRAAQRTYQKGQVSQATMMFIRASRDFRRGGSPLTYAADYYAANTIFDQGRVDEARSRLEQLAVQTPPEYAALRAQVDWERGLVYASLGRWQDALHVLDSSIARFERLGERAHATTVREVLAEVYDRLGEYRMAQRHRLTALRSETNERRLQVVLAAAADSAAAMREWPVSISLLGLQLDLTRRIGDEHLYAPILLKRALLAHRIGRVAMARADLVHAREAIDRIHEPFKRDLAEANYLAVAGTLAPSPAAAVPLLTQAIDFHRTKGMRTRLPEIYLQRGRAHAALGQVDEAAVNFERGIRELEEQRTSIARTDEQMKVATAREDLFDEAIALAMSRGDIRRAFLYAERARATALLTNLKEPTLSAAPDSVIVEYAALPTRLVIFVSRDGRVDAVQCNVRRETLAREIERLTKSATLGDSLQFHRSASALYDQLVAPIATRLATGRTLVFIPDATLSSVPFSALRGPDGRYIVEQHAVVVAPSASLFAQLSTRAQAATDAPRLLLFGGPSRHDSELGLLFSAQREADAIAAVYGRRAEFAPKGIDHADFERRAAAADVLHFSGHAVDDNANAALVTFGENGASEHLTADQIAAMRLPRTRLVVLAACNTARDRQNGLSLAQAFLAAGVPSVVATLWPIEDDHATEFFARLHQRLAEGLSPADAVRATQIEWLHRGDTSQALSAWAAVQVIGSNGLAVHKAHRSPEATHLKAAS